METHTSDGRRLTYTELGSGPRLVCHPGGPGFSGAYFGDLGGVASARTVVAVDPAGTGGSDPWTEEAYSLDRRADDLDELRAALGEEQLDLLGHSAGGFVAIRYATRHPERVGRLVLVGTFAHFDALRAERDAFLARKESEPEFAGAVAAARERMSAGDLPPERKHELLLRSFPLYLKRLTPAARAFAEEVARGDPPDIRTLDSFNAQVGGFDLRPELGRIDAPALVVHGDAELERAGQRELLAGLPNATAAEISDAGHFPWIEQPERFRDVVLEFLSA